MLSDRQVRANRQNAQKSCGPKTIEGKKRSSRNAIRHGLTLINRHNAQYAASIRSFAEHLCGAYRDRELLEAALIIAETQFILATVRQRAVSAMEGCPQAFSLGRRNEKFVNPLLSTSKVYKVYDNVEGIPTCMKGRPLRPQAAITANRPARTEFEAIAEAVRMLLRLDRYERRAWSWRRKAFRQFVKRRNELDRVPK